MSRIGRKLITVPAGVDVKIGTDTVTVKGPKGTLSEKYNPKYTTVKLDAGTIEVTRVDDEKISKSLHGTTRTIINNMVVGVTEVLKRNLKSLVLVTKLNSKVKILFFHSVIHIKSFSNMKMASFMKYRMQTQ
jgi:large subunit ribosomal protein L6